MQPQAQVPGRNGVYADAHHDERYPLRTCPTYPSSTAQGGGGSFKGGNL